VLTDPLNHTTTYLTDATGKLTRVTAANQSQSFTYTADYQVATTTDTLGHTTTTSTSTYSKDGKDNRATIPTDRFDIDLTKTAVTGTTDL